MRTLYYEGTLLLSWLLEEMGLTPPCPVDQ